MVQRIVPPQVAQFESPRMSAHSTGRSPPGRRREIHLHTQDESPYSFYDTMRGQKMPQCKCNRTNCFVIVQSCQPAASDAPSDGSNPEASSRSNSKTANTKQAPQHWVIGLSVVIDHYELVMHVMVALFMYGSIPDHHDFVKQALRQPSDKPCNARDNAEAPATCVVCSRSVNSSYRCEHRAQHTGQCQTWWCSSNVITPCPDLVSAEVHYDGPECYQQHTR